MIRVDNSIGVKLRKLIDTIDKEEKVELKGLNKDEFFLESELDKISLYIYEDRIAFLYNDRFIKVNIKDIMNTDLSWVKNIEFNRVEKIDNSSLYYILSSIKNLKSISFSFCSSIDDDLVQLLLNSNPDLEDLSIVGQGNLVNLDLNNKKKLKKLELMNNDNLFKINGLDKFNNMQLLTFIDNQSYESIDDICTLALKSGGAEIDVLYFYKMKEMIGSDIDLKNKIQFCETIHQTYEDELKSTVDDKYLKYSFAVTQDFYNRAKKIIDTYISDDDTVEEKHAIIHQWICENITYDFERLRNSDMATGMKNGTNGIVNAFLHKQVVCEGFAKLEQLLLQMCGIKSSIVGCKCQYKGKLEPHGILFISFPNGKYGYNDITFDAGSFQRGEEMEYLLLSKDEISKDHFLIGQDDRISYGSGYTKEQANKLIKFAQDRIKAVNEKGFKVNNVNNIINEIETLYNVNLDSMDSFDLEELLRRIRRQTNMHEIDYKTGRSMMDFLESRIAQLTKEEQNTSVKTQSAEKKESIFDKIKNGKMTPKDEYRRYSEDLKKYHGYSPVSSKIVETNVSEREQLISLILEKSSFGGLDDILVDRLNKMSLEELQEILKRDSVEEIEKRRMM
jgi:hypothetical protein